jgi:hypothetical protein
MRGIRIVAMAALLGLVACANGPGSTVASGVRGFVQLGPICPVEIAGSASCSDIPFHGIVAASDASGEVARVQTEVSGAFRMALPPGTYTLVAIPAGSGGLPTAKPQTVVVRAGTYTEVTLQVDTGIR